jgi:lipopolysaccharide/colanic/teichoic acid biosynthesis glycosyltransferase
LVLLLAVVAIAIKVASRGPVLFRQRRIGYQGRSFTLYKFRTMEVDADPGIHAQYTRDLIRNQTPMVKLDAYGDPRLIRGGALLRASGLDELPQVFNVLRGDMSLVGPRPCTPDEYSEHSPSQRERCNILPGLTGLWQVSGKNQATFDEMVELDVRYARDCSLALDLKIMLKTLPVLMREVQDVAKRQGAPAAVPVNGAKRVNGETKRDSQSANLHLPEHRDSPLPRGLPTEAAPPNEAKPERQGAQEESH